MKKWIGTNIKSKIIFGGLIFLIVPIVVYFLSTLPIFPVGGNNDWAGFWGGYLGAIMGAFVAIYVMKQTINIEKMTRKENERNQFLNEITETIAELCTRINKSNSDLLRFHNTGEEKWNYEALYGLNEVTKQVSVLQIKLLSRAENDFEKLDELHKKIVSLDNDVTLLHKTKFDNFDVLKKDADKISEHLSELMSVVANFVMINRK